MLRHFTKQLNNSAKAVNVFGATTQRFYTPDGVLMKRVQGEYYSDPKVVAERVVRIIALHDACKDPSNVTPGQTFAQLGLNPLDMVEIYLGIERELDIEIACDDCETFETVDDIIEHCARNSATII